MICDVDIWATGALELLHTSIIFNIIYCIHYYPGRTTFGFENRNLGLIQCHNTVKQHVTYGNEQ